MTEPWQRQDIITWTQRLLDSYEQLLQRPLIERSRSPLDQSQALFAAPFVVVSHGLGDDPILNYGNQTALALWEMNWQELIQTPSRQTAEPPNQAERAQLLAQVARQGYIENYEGVRISRTGKRFFVQSVTVWTVGPEGGRDGGQAATFRHWQFL